MKVVELYYYDEVFEKVCVYLFGFEFMFIDCSVWCELKFGLLISC